MFTISENSGIKPTTKKGFYSGSKQMKKELGTRNSMADFDTKITSTTSKFFRLLKSGKFKEIKFLNRFFLDKEKANKLFNKLQKGTDYV